MYYRKFNTHSQLKKVMLGSYFPEDYFDFIDDSDIRNSLMKIAKEINEDLEYFQQVLKRHGVEVLRPNIPPKNKFIDHWNQTGEFLSPPLQPRNYHSVIGNKIYQLNNHETVDYINAVLPGEIIDLSKSNQQVFLNGCLDNIDCYNISTDTWHCKEKYQELAGPDWPSFYDYVKGNRTNILFIQNELDYFKDALCYETKEFTELLGPNLFPVDNRLYVDCKEYFDYKKWVLENVEFSGEIVVMNSKAGHSDGCFIVLGNQVIIGVVPSIDYKTLFPGYRIIKASDSYEKTVSKRKEIGTLIQKKWWVPGEENNKKLINYVEVYMQNYIGNAYETSFDLNVLAINDNTICMVQCESDIVDQLNNIDIDVIEIPWRHRFFVDCGIHCLTLDLFRE
jgi:hypothetical protein